MPFDPSILELGRLYTRPQLAQLWGYAGYHAIARGVVTPRGGGHVVLFVTRQKQEMLTQYQDFMSGDYLHWEGEEGHGTDIRIAHAHERGETVYLFYRDIHHTPFRYHGPLEIRDVIFRDPAPSRFIFRLVHDLSPEDDLATHAAELQAADPTDRWALRKARIGQGDFREKLRKRWEGCAVTGVQRADLLRASHIKPWRVSSNDERLSEFNGLLLLPQYDHLFDRGYISFTNDGDLLQSPAIVTLPPHLLGIALQAKLRDVAAQHLPFLDFHRREVFLSRTDRE